MEDCKLYNTTTDACSPSLYVATHHVHILVRKGTMQFSDGRRVFHSAPDDLVIWQLSNSIQQITYSDDFEADFLIVAPQFLVRYNPEMVWAAKGFIFIRTCPSFHLSKASLQLIDADFALFRQRMLHPTAFQTDVLGRVLQIFLFDLWTVYREGLAQQTASDNASRLFMRFLTMAQDEVLTHREVSHYADRLCITPKYLSQICVRVSGISAMQWIAFYATYELVSLLDDSSKSITEISDIMDFSSAAAFSTYTRKLLGLSPSDYRKAKGL